MVLRGFQFLIPLITLPYLVRTIGLEKFGLINFALSLGLYFGAVIQYGFGVTATREIARNRDDPEKLSQIYSSTLVASCLLALLCVVVFIPIVFLVEQFREYLGLYLFTIAFVVFQSLFPIWFFQGMEKMKYITFLSLGASIMFLISLFTFVKEQDDFVLVPLLNASAALITFMIATTLIIKNFKVKFTRPKIQEIKCIYKNGYHSFVIQLAPNFYNNSTVFLLGLFANNSLVGIYTAALKVIEAFMSLALILTNTFLPFLARGLSKHGVFLKIMGSTGFSLTVVSVLFSEFITNVLYAAAGGSISIYVKLLAPWILMIFLRNALGVNYLMLVGYEREYKNIILYSSLFSFALALVFIPIFGIIGAIMTINIAALLMLIFTVALYVKVKNEKN